MLKRYETKGRWIWKSTCSFLGVTLCVLLGASTARAAVLDYFGPPLPGDPSVYGEPVISDNVSLGPPANDGSFLLQGGVQGTLQDAGVNNVVPAPGQNNGGFNVPTNSSPSPLFGAVPFTQQMLLFEEFGPEPLDGSWAQAPPPGTTTFPAPPDAQSGPDPTALEAFLAEQGVAPYPTEFANTQEQNPWKSVIAGFIGRPLDNTWTPPAEGRPPGEAWAHQRWLEFYPQVYYKTAQAGARVNGGFRDSYQMHGYSVGEFGPGGLYHRVYSSSVPGAPTLDGTTNGLSIRFHPNMPIQDPKALWTFDGTLPPKLLMARYGQPILMRHYNALPVDPAANRGFGLHTISTHEHNGHSPAESDGYTNAFFFPGQFYDYRWPMQLAGYDTINTSATDPRAAFPCAPGETLFVNDADNTLTRKTCDNGSIKIRGDWHETMSTHWFHDHMLDFTAQNVYKGNAVMMNYYSALDRGNEGFIDNVNLRFPSGTALPWGNRDYDVNLLIADKAWDNTGQLWFNIFNTDGFIGDQVMVNWLWRPYLDVRARRYRFRILNGSVSRYYSLALVRQVIGSGGEMPGPAGSGVSYNRVPFYMIANDGNIMEHAVPFDGSMDLYNTGKPLDFKGVLPTQGIAERYDIVVDFSSNNPAGIQPGDKLYLVNVLEHTTGQVVGRKVPLADILSEAYLPVIKVNSNGTTQWDKGDPGVTKILELRVQAYSGTDLSMDPRNYLPANGTTPAGLTMIPLTIHFDNAADLAKLADVRHRTFSFERGGTDLTPWVIKTDDGLLPTPALGYNMDPRRVSASPQLSTGPTQAGYAGDGTLEDWTITGGGGWDHPVHIHFEEGIVLSRGGKAPPEWEKWARKDLYRIGPDVDSTLPVEMAIHFREFAGTYMEHCHNTQHEDHAMLLRWDIEHPGQFTTMATPLPTWDGVQYVNSAALPTFRTVLLSESPIDNATVGATVTITATTFGLAGPLEYQFLDRSSPDGSWVETQAYSPSNTYAWNTTGYAAGTYETKVNVRNASTAAPVGMGIIPCTLTSSVATGVNITPDQPGPHLAGTAVLFTASGTGSSGYQYRFWLFDGVSWSMVQDYGVGATWSLPASTPAGNYTIAVDVRTSASVYRDAVAYLPYQIGSAVSPAIGVDITPDQTSPHPAGTAVLFTASGTGSSGYQYRFCLYDGVSWSMVQDYGVGATWSLPASTPAGNYTIAVDVRTSTNVYRDSVGYISYQIQ